MSDSFLLGLLCEIGREGSGLGSFQIVVADLLCLSSAEVALGIDQMSDQDLQHRPDNRNGEQYGEQNEFSSEHA